MQSEEESKSKQEIMKWKYNTSRISQYYLCVQGSDGMSVFSADFLGFLSFRLEKTRLQASATRETRTHAERWVSEELFGWSSLLRSFSPVELIELTLFGCRAGRPLDAIHLVFEKSSRATGRTGIKGWCRAMRIHPLHEVSDGMNWSANSSNYRTLFVIFIHSRSKECLHSKFGCGTAVPVSTIQLSAKT